MTPETTLVRDLRTPGSPRRRVEAALEADLVRVERFTRALRARFGPEDALPAPSAEALTLALQRRFVRDFHLPRSLACLATRAEVLGRASASRGPAARARDELEARERALEAAHETRGPAGRAAFARAARDLADHLDAMVCSGRITLAELRASAPALPRLSLRLDLDAPRTRVSLRETDHLLAALESAR